MNFPYVAGYGCFFLVPIFFGGALVWKFTILLKFRNETRFLLPKTIETEELEIVMCMCTVHIDDSIPIGSMGLVYLPTFG